MMVVDVASVIGELYLISREDTLYQKKIPYIKRSYLLAPYYHDYIKRSSIPLICEVIK